MIGSIEHQGWRVEFFRFDDRVAHRIARLTASGCAILATSIEGTPDQDWPPSPPLQHVHFEQRGHGDRVALLVGMAGRSHWSASAEMDSVTGALVWDVACRTADLPAWLGTTYYLGAPASVLAATARFQIGDQCATIVFRTGDGEPIHAEQCDGQLRWRVPAVAAPQARTIRWQYRIALENPAGE